MTNLARRKIAVAAAFPHLTLVATEDVGFVVPRDFSIAQDRVSRNCLLDSFVSTPSRYLYELYCRTREDVGAAVGAILVFNPLLRPSAFLVRTVLAHVRENPVANRIVIASNGHPVAYLLATDYAEDLRHLLLLSCSNPQLDRDLLTEAFGRNFQAATVPFPASLTVTNGFLAGDYCKPMEWCAAHAITLLRKHRADRSGGSAGAAGRNRDLKFSAFFTHHAGDVLFMAIAAHRTQTPLYDEMVVHQDYLPITDRFASGITFTPLEGPVPFRRGYNREDCQHFLDAAPNLPADRLYVYCRTTRNYNFTDFHYVDHFRFCIGRDIIDEADLIRGIPIVPARPQLSCNAGDLRTALLHFDAGWPLKIYPPEFQRALVDSLHERGFKVRVLDAREPPPGCEPIKFADLATLDRQLESIDALIGMDSFPAHYAAQVRGIPTLHLFASTHPIHSNAGTALDRRSVQNGEACCPCLGWDKCVRYGGGTCRNFASPADVVGQLDAALAKGAAADGPDVSPFPPLPSSKCPRQFRKISPKTLMLTQDFLSRRRIRARRPWMLLAGVPQTLLILAGDFHRTVRNEGLRKALYLTKAFLYRRFFGGTSQRTLP